jgi:hypothetical protein
VKIIIDCNGTLIANRDLSQADCASAVQRMSDAGHPVRLVSSLPGGELCGRPIGDKPDALMHLGPGDVLIDDELALLVVACRMGAVTVPASQLVAFAALLCPTRP